MKEQSVGGDAECVLCRVLFGFLYIFYGALLLICRARPMCIVIVNQNANHLQCPQKHSSLSINIYNRISQNHQWIHHKQYRESPSRRRIF